MDAYTGFAYVYDEYMDNIPYEEWGQYMIALLKENGVSGDSSVLELGCGTGTVTRMLAKEGYDCVGLDMSEDMLSIASEKTFEEGSQVIYTCQDMRDFEVPYEVDGMISIGAENREDSAFIWDNYYDEKERNNEYELAVFVKNEDGTFDRFEEQHYQHGFTIDEVTGAVNKAGLTVKNVYNAFTKDMPDDKSERLYFVIEK